MWIGLCYCYCYCYCTIVFIYKKILGSNLFFCVASAHLEKNEHFESGFAWFKVLILVKISVPCAGRNRHDRDLANIIGGNEGRGGGGSIPDWFIHWESSLSLVFMDSRVQNQSDTIQYNWWAFPRFRDMPTNSKARKS